MEMSGDSKPKTSYKTRANLKILSSFLQTAGLVIATQEAYDTENYTNII